ncbi:hypothetical protein Syn7502_00724 [Synechococcus sp. PCC 7502]|nr:hypothetical protein Syn7502_00724 [Synechococcus sp. PCC 7502]
MGSDTGVTYQLSLKTFVPVDTNLKFCQIFYKYLKCINEYRSD